ncbi:MAG: phosphoglycolate phosphatase [Nitrososphaerota archaeon]
MKVRAFVTDVDGTMTENYPVIDLEAASVLKNLVKMGYKVVLASGRSIYELYSLSMFLGLGKYAVGENGAIIVEGTAEKIKPLADNWYPLQALSYLEKDLPEVKVKSSLPRFTEVVLERVPEVERVRESLKKSGLPVRVLDSGYAYHIVNQHVSKALGVKELLNALSIKPDETVAFGDSETDVSLFQLCGYSVAMANSDEEAKAHARHITNASQGKGLIEAVDFVFAKLAD